MEKVFPQQQSFVQLPKAIKEVNLLEKKQAEGIMAIHQVKGRQSLYRIQILKSIFH